MITRSSLRLRTWPHSGNGHWSSDCWFISYCAQPCGILAHWNGDAEGWPSAYEREARTLASQIARLREIRNGETVVVEKSGRITVFRGRYSLATTLTAST